MILVNEIIDINEKEVLDVDPMILMGLRDRLTTRKPFSYVNGDGIDNGENEKKMREGTK